MRLVYRQANRTSTIFEGPNSDLRAMFEIHLVYASVMHSFLSTIGPTEQTCKRAGPPFTNILCGRLGQIRLQSQPECSLVFSSNSFRSTFVLKCHSLFMPLGLSCELQKQLAELWRRSTLHALPIARFSLGRDWLCRADSNHMRVDQKVLCMGFPLGKTTQLMIFPTKWEKLP